MLLIDSIFLQWIIDVFWLFYVQRIMKIDINDVWDERFQGLITVQYLKWKKYVFNETIKEYLQFYLKKIIKERRLKI